MSTPEKATPSHFIRQIIQKDLSEGKNSGQVATRFPPEPNGYLHIGHAKSICLNFGLATEFDGTCNLRFDDTNPEKESEEYINAIKADVEWLGFEWNDDIRYASNYFSKIHEYAVQLIEQGQAYVESLSVDEIREYRGTLTEPGKDSPYRNRSVEENIDLFQRMKAGEFDEGTLVLRAKIDMSSGNINMRDPVIYRIRKVEHHQTGNEWCIYPMYDFTHCISDAIEGITHSVCTLEFEAHRPLYDWVLDSLGTPSHPQQIEFARLNLNYTITSKRKLKQLVDEGVVSGWDDPRMPTVAGLRRRGYSPGSIRNFCEMIGVTKSDGVVDMGMLEFSIRDDLDKSAPRAMCVLRPLKVVIENMEEGAKETLSMSAHPKDESMGSREIHFTREIYIDRDDFAEVPPPKYKRLIEGGEVRLRGCYVIKCQEIIKDADGNIIELRCTRDIDTLGKKPEGRKVKGVVHWVSAETCVDAEIRMYDRLFTAENPDSNKDGRTLLDVINPESLTVFHNCKAESGLVGAVVGKPYQFEREGYFVLDSDAHKSKNLVFNRTVTLRDSWTKIAPK